MTSTNRRAQADALLPLAAGRSQAAVAREVGVSRSTVAAWLRNPVFAREVARLRPLWEAKPLDTAALLAASIEAADRVNPPAGPVVVSIPAGASPRRRRQLLAKGIAKALEGGS
ncbi:helix-turn-helix domain-containing protein [Streptomyces sp. ADMS]|uniref:helix-turn-helix domain-containing protein n=1 Tax=Streptomyces sp. ADMS TaxID=3071415 RepID=UPI00296F4208|nr:helix-turn-helix domain-containing protein [Streptomyces sp. ADMS]MDW4904456.1 helix-turn-helix domain-containing protein [Streptomyces sp. ADMS]